MTTTWANDREDEEREAHEDERIADLCQGGPSAPVQVMEEIRFGECLSDEEMIAVTTALMQKWGL